MVFIHIDINNILILVIPAIPNAFGSRESFRKDSGQAGMTNLRMISRFCDE
jgi:hypothetical protein